MELCFWLQIELFSASQECSDIVGIDMSPIMSLMTRVESNSFCDEEHPNCQIIYKGDYHLVIAINRIEKGDEIKVM